MEHSKHLILLKKVYVRSRGGTDFFASKFMILKDIIIIIIIIIVKGNIYERPPITGIKDVVVKTLHSTLSASVRTRVEQRNRLTLSHITS